MTHKYLFPKSGLLTLVTSALLFFTGAARVVADPDFTFSGGGGAPLSITFNTQLMFNMPTGGGEFPRGEFLIFSGIYDGPTSGDIGGDAKPITVPNYTIDDSEDPDHRATIAYLTDINGSAASNDVTSSDFMLGFTKAARYTEEGDYYYFLAGQTLTTTGAWASDPSDYASSFSMFIVDEHNVRISEIVEVTGVIGVTAVPEPATTAALLGLSAAALVMIRRRRS